MPDATRRATAYRTLFVTSLVGFMVALEITVIALARDEIRAGYAADAVEPEEQVPAKEPESE